MGERRGGTRERIQQVALELFAEKGYENTALREVSERLEITRPALYYHFKTKDDILDSVVADLTGSMDELIEWARRQPRTVEARRDTLSKIAELLTSQWRPLIRFAQANQTTMQTHRAGEHMQQRVLALVSLLADPDADLRQQFEARLAVFALILGNVPFIFNLDVPEERLSEISLGVATKLVSNDT
ncbi:MAG: TetR/AcrR family transcriptional regulator [Streptosporangiaceae bacterium]